MNRREQLLQVAEQDIQLDTADYTRLQTLMHELHQALLAHNCPQIDELNENIATLLGNLSGRAQRRSKILGAFGLGSGSQAMSQFFQQYAATRRGTIRQQWDQLGQLTSQCKFLNERNGKLLAMHNDILTRLLDNQRDAQLYSPQFF